MNNLLLGAIAMGSMVAALFFLRFWRSTGDRFFLFFALSFFIEGINRAVLGPAAQTTLDESPAYYLVRLLSYGLILCAILDKNRPR
ncbi:DUF5985 family protein [Noviherbaspirillum denitrificans]|uniref:Uncharacterized protein n=1 Tax=Noviherbaspirillum denitrificans TaxID=1968433 RepID=A0A254T9D4_9BURK|nr:DUF5985 family protein [Noviherbaspirillum denitrificans]OWW19185.1 hypothetical protein AYR66_06400 [Noviherbaspirillum denitrificans]